MVLLTRPISATHHDPFAEVDAHHSELGMIEAQDDRPRSGGHLGGKLPGTLVRGAHFARLRVRAPTHIGTRFAGAETHFRAGCKLSIDTATRSRATWRQL